MPFRLWRRGELRITARPVEPTSPHRIHAPSSATVQRCHHDLLCYACRLHYAQIRPYINSEDPLAASLPVDEGAAKQCEPSRSSESPRYQRQMHTLKSRVLAERDTTTILARAAHTVAGIRRRRLIRTGRRRIYHPHVRNLPSY
jgi:hypothetical protein